MSMSERNRRLLELQDDLDRVIDTRVHETEDTYGIEFTETEIADALKGAILARQGRE